MNLAGEDIDQAEVLGMSEYKTDIGAALAKEHEGLRKVLLYSTQNKFDGAASESYSARIAYLLKLWGDHAFAAVLKSEPATVKKEILRRLDEFAVDEHIKQFPETSALGEHRLGD